jgi:hypothetical protein
MNWEDIIKRGQFPGDNVYGRIRAKLQANDSPSGKIEALLHLFEQEGILHGNKNPYDLAESILKEFIHLIDEKEITRMIDEGEDKFNKNRPKSNPEIPDVAGKGIDLKEEFKDLR